MFDHVTIRVADRAAAEAFYDTVLTPLGIDRTYRTAMFSEWHDLPNAKPHTTLCVVELIGTHRHQYER